MNYFDTKMLLMRDARKLGICKEGYEDMRAKADIQSLVGYYVAHPDWCMSRAFPDLDTLRQHKDVLAENGVFVDTHFDEDNPPLLNERQVYMFHHCTGTIQIGLNVDKALIPMIYFGNGCSMTILPDKSYDVEVSIYVPLYVFGGNTIRPQDTKYVMFSKCRKGFKE